MLNDADATHITSDYLPSIISVFDYDRTLDAATGLLEWDRKTLITQPALLFATRVYQYINSVKARQEDRHVFPGANAAIRGSAYCAANGGHDLDRGEDVALGLALHVMRQGTDHIVAGLPGMALETSARRTVDAFQQGFAPNEKWRLGFSAFDELRTQPQPLYPEIDLYNQADIEFLTTTLEMLLDRVLEVYEGKLPLGKGANVYRFALGNLGIDYDVIQDSNTSKIKLKPLHETTIDALRMHKAMVR